MIYFSDSLSRPDPLIRKLRKAIKKANRVLDFLLVEKHPDKTFIGRVARGFDFMGYRFTPGAAHGLQVAKKTIENHVARISRLYEQGADVERIWMYIHQWWHWLNAGLGIHDQLHVQREKIMILDHASVLTHCKYK